MSDVQWQEIEDSSMISGIARDGDDLLIRFARDGKVFRQMGAGYHFDLMKREPSIGSYFHNNIRGQFDAEREEGLEE